MPLAVLLSFRFLIDLHGTKKAVEDEDELEALASRVDALPTDTEVRRIAPTKARRLKRI